MYDGAMAVVPQAVEKEEVEAAGFEAIGPVTDWPYFANGYKLLLKVADA